MKKTKNAEIRMTNWLKNVTAVNRENTCATMQSRVVSVCSVEMILLSFSRKGRRLHRLCRIRFNCWGLNASHRIMATTGNHSQVQAGGTAKKLKNPAAPNSTIQTRVKSLSTMVKPMVGSAGALGTANARANCPTRPGVRIPKVQPRNRDATISFMGTPGVCRRRR